MKDIDNEILTILQKNARTPFLRIAKQLEVSEGTIRKRVAKLQKNGTIKKFTIIKNRESNIIIGIQTNPQFHTSEIVGKILEYGVYKILEVTGRFDALCFISTSDMESANDILEKIRTTEGIVHTETFITLKES